MTHLTSEHYIGGTSGLISVIPPLLAAEVDENLIRVWPTTPNMRAVVSALADATLDPAVRADLLRVRRNDPESLKRERALSRLVENRDITDALTYYMKRGSGRDLLEMLEAALHG